MLHSVHDGSLFGLPVFNDRAWAFDHEMIISAWGKYVETNPERFTTDFVMQCASLPPHAAEALHASRLNQGDMNPDIIKYIAKQTSNTEFARNHHDCPKLCVCPGSFKEVFTASLAPSIQSELRKLAAKCDKTVSDTLYFIEL